MSKCDCWHEVEPFCYNDKINGVCYGTKEREYCQCNGDNAKCDFYPEKRKENKTMKTLEMMNAAKENGKTYKLYGLNIFYNDKHGFIGADWNEVMLQEFANQLTFNKFFDFDWSERSSLMTVAEAEEKYGIKIIG